MSRAETNGRALLRFAIVGGIGFVVDAATLALLIWLTGVSPYAGRVPSYIVAATATWWLNRRITFNAAHMPHALRQWRRFLAANLTGAIVNYGVFALVVSAEPASPSLPLLGVAAGSIAGLIFNFYLSARFVFSR